jgi:hypothetical protein
MTTAVNPIWWESIHDFAWDHIKLELSRGLGTRQVDVAEATPPKTLPDFNEFESAYRFGYGARLEFEMELNDGDFSQIDLEREWRTMNPNREAQWEQDSIAILFGWSFEAEGWESLSIHAGEKLGGSVNARIKETVTQKQAT